MTKLSKSEYPRLISSEVLFGSQKAAQKLGINLRPILLEFQIQPTLLESPEGFLSHYQVINFLETVAERFDCQHFGFLVGNYQPTLSIGELGQLFKLAPNLHIAFEKAMLYANIYSEMSKYELIIDGDYATIIRRSQVSYRGKTVQLHMLGIVQVFKILKMLCGTSWRATSIFFSHSAPKGNLQYLHFFECPVVYEQEFDGIFFHANDLETPIKTANVELMKIVCAYLDSIQEKKKLGGNIVIRVRNHLQQQLGGNNCNLESIAQLLNLHPRTLQRTLAKYDCTFQQLLVDVRMEATKHYLRNSNMSLSDMTGMLGYKNLSAFSRAFKNSTGVSLIFWRKENSLLT